MRIALLNPGRSARADGNADVHLLSRNARTAWNWVRVRRYAPISHRQAAKTPAGALLCSHSEGNLDRFYTSHRSHSADPFQQYPLPFGISSHYVGVIAVSKTGPPESREPA